MERQPLHYLWRPATAAIAALVIIITWMVPVTRQCWLKLDHVTFAALNGGLAGNEAAQQFWAFMSMRTEVFDITAALLLILPFMYYMRTSDPQEVLKRATQGLYMGVVITVTILLAKEFSSARSSPSFVLVPLVDLSNVLSWAEAKVFAKYTFPSDHGIATLLLAVFYWHYAGRKYGLPMLLLGMFFCLPRLVAGAHWLTDIAVGSVFVTFIVASVTVATPCEAWCLAKLQKIPERPFIKAILLRLFLKQKAT